jgi:hypothetical protein
MINLTTCIEGQKLRLRDGRIVIYSGVTPSHLYPYAAICWEGEDLLYTYTQSGMYNTLHGSHSCDVIEILPLETTEPASHPSVVWWESCPWITDRRPAKEDGDHLGRVIQQVSSKTETALDLCFVSWAYVKQGQTWIHSLNWNPLKQTPKEKALALIAKHKDSSTVGVWVPTPDEWNVISEGLEAL